MLSVAINQSELVAFGLNDLRKLSEIWIPFHLDFGRTIFRHSLYNTTQNSRFFLRLNIELRSVKKCFILNFPGDGNVNSKKEGPIRSKELFDIAAPHILKYLAENLIDIIKEGGTRYVLREMFRFFWENQFMAPSLNNVMVN